MASPSLAQGATLPIAAATVRAVLTPAGAPAPPARTAVEVRALELDADGRPARPGTLPGDGLLPLAALEEPGVAAVLLCARIPRGLTDLVLRIADAADGRELARFDMAVVAVDGAELIVGELFRHAGGWKFRAVGEAWAQDPATFRQSAGPGVPPQASPRRAAGRPRTAVTVPGPRAVPGTDGGGPAEAAWPLPPPSPVRRPAPDAALLPDAMRARFALRREQVRVSVRKHGAARAAARVALVLDASASMSGLYARGVVRDVVERMAAVVAELDEEATARAWTFASQPARLPDLTPAGLPDWLDLHVRAGQLGLLGRPRRRRRGLHPDQVDMRLVGVHNEEHRVMAEVRAYVREHPDPRPTLVLFFSDGGVRRDTEIARQLREAADEPLFWQFVGLGRAHYGVLTRFGTPHGHRGNAGFFVVDDVTRTSDEELYDRLLAGFPAWLAQPRGPAGA